MLDDNHCEKILMKKCYGIWIVFAEEIIVAQAVRKK
jgi:hypothetical protein